MAEPLVPNLEFQEIHRRILLSSIYAHALRSAGEYSDSLSVIPGGLYFNDASFCDWLLIHYPDGPHGQQ